MSVSLVAPPPQPSYQALENVSFSRFFLLPEFCLEISLVEAAGKPQREVDGARRGVMTQS
jgi:hypothetical protein